MEWGDQLLESEREEWERQREIVRVRRRLMQEDVVQTLCLTLRHDCHSLTFSLCIHHLDKL